jgi:hypothetical protein
MSETVLVGIAFAFIGLTLIYAYDRWIRPRVAARWMSKALTKTRSGKSMPPRKQSDYGIFIDATGFSVSRTGGTAPLLSVAWSDVLRLTAFKRDLLIVDCICMAIATRDGRTIEVNEEMVGWDAFTEALPRYLPGSGQWVDWFWQVAFPAFATNETQIFARGCAPSVGLPAGEGTDDRSELTDPEAG